MEHVLLLHKKGKNKPFNPLTLTFEGESLFPTVKKKILEYLDHQLNWCGKRDCSAHDISLKHTHELRRDISFLKNSKVTRYYKILCGCAHVYILMITIDVCASPGCPIGMHC